MKNFKSILFLALLFFSVLVNAQSDCNTIKRQVYGLEQTIVQLEKKVTESEMLIAKYPPKTNNNVTRNAKSTIKYALQERQKALLEKNSLTNKLRNCKQ